MKNLFLFFTINLLLIVTLHAQTSMGADYDKLLDTYYVPVKRLAGTVLKACDGNVPFGMKCKLHDKTCWCNPCAENYNREKKKLDAKYENVQFTLSTPSNANAYKNTSIEYNKPETTITYQAPTPITNSNKMSLEQDLQAIKNTSSSIVAQYNTTNSEQLSNALVELATVLTSSSMASEPSSTDFVHKLVNAMIDGKSFLDQGSIAYDKGEYKKAYKYFLKSAKKLAVYKSMADYSLKYASNNPANDLTYHKREVSEADLLYNKCIEDLKLVDSKLEP